MRDGINPQARSVAARQPPVEQVDAVGNFSKHRIKCLIDELEPRNFGVTQVDDDAGALRRLNAGITHGVTQGLRPVGLWRACTMVVWSSPHALAQMVTPTLAVKTVSATLPVLRVPAGSNTTTSASWSASGRCSTPRGTTSPSPGPRSTTRSRNPIRKNPL